MPWVSGSHKSPLSPASASVPLQHKVDLFPPENAVQRSLDKSVGDRENTGFIKTICQQETDRSSHPCASDNHKQQSCHSHTFLVVRDKDEILANTDFTNVSLNVWIIINRIIK